MKASGSFERRPISDATKRENRASSGAEGMASCVIPPVLTFAIEPVAAIATIDFSESQPAETSK